MARTKSQIGLSSNRKGKSGERELVIELKKLFGDPGTVSVINAIGVEKKIIGGWCIAQPMLLDDLFKRNLDQVDNGGIFGDIGGPACHILRWALECKRAAKYSGSWIKQALAQAPEGYTGVVAYRIDRKKWMVEARACDLVYGVASECHRVTITLDAWAELAITRALDEHSLLLDGSTT